MISFLSLLVSIATTIAFVFVVLMMLTCLCRAKAAKQADRNGGF
ncbi:hypothetical protein K1718_13210 [Roseibium porphyridii]|uniref:Uncharacterized protein n=1 Tax=Roseibium porphyridii TaxID=2866279 RepID=A0ABY8F9U8_9HYPH|nr:hypothetical protein [Roseibium sp. KMA01]WFE92278.1 hypothetical protein K1718_13210 [Roseibium sp. KMA01]